MDIPSSSANKCLEDKDLPQCKIKRNYCCSHCSYFTQNPRIYLTHLRDVHGERINISNCSLCLYASRHYQKLVRHMKMVHGSTAEAIPGQSRKRPLVEDVLDFPAMPPLPTPPSWIFDIDNLSYDLESSRKTLRDFAAIYFAENEAAEILAKMEASDIVEVAPARDALPSIEVPSQTIFNDPKYVTDKELEMDCPCGHVAKCFLDLLIHEKSCPEATDKSYPLDLRVRSSKDDVSTPNSPQQCDFGNHEYEKVSQRENKELPKIPDSKAFDIQAGEEKPKIKNEVQDDDQVSSVIAQDESKSIVSHKKFFKCRLCPFRASTASRIAVHIVAHRNKKRLKSITKHIPLRTSSSTNHKIDRVLQQEEHDRRGYVCDTSEQNEEFKIKKFGDMISSKHSSKMGNCGQENNNFKDASSNEKETKLKYKSKRESPLEVLQNESCPRTRSKQSNPRSYLVLENADKPVYKCNKCHFRHPNRDAVLVHVKIQHQDLLKSLQISPKQANTTTGLCKNLKTTPCEEPKNCPKSNQQVKNSSKQPFVDDVDHDETAKSSPSPSKNDCSTMKKASTGPSLNIKKNSLENNNKVADLIVSKTSNDSYAPFRCWHCHQGSNWKHVIQRHCRLKHSGSIRIETIDRSIGANNPTYRMLHLLSNSEVLPNGIRSAIKSESPRKDEKKTKHQNSSGDSGTELSTKMHDISLRDSKKSQSKVTKSEKEILTFECPDCDYFCSNKQQLNTHFAQKHTPSELSTKKSQKTFDHENSVVDSAGKLEKCQYCLFLSSCHSAMKCHERSHFRVLNQKDSPIYKEPQKSEDRSDLQSTKIVDKNKTELLTSLIPKTTEDDSIGRSLSKNVSQSKHEVKHKTYLKVKPHQTVSSENLNNYKKSASLPAKSNIKTILVNPKTGQVVRRN